MDFRRIFFIFTLLVAPALMATVTIDDFSQLNKTVVDGIFYPKSSLEIEDIVACARRAGKKISVAGKRHSQGGHAFYPNNIVIDINGFNKILNLDEENKIITVQTGVTWEQIQEFINPYNLAIKVMQTTQIFTVGGSLSVNAHGRDPNHGPLIETIKAIRILLASGKIVQASRAENYELFKLAIGGYGLFGIILEADIELTDNVLYTRKAEIIRTKNYSSFLQQHVINNGAVGLHYGIVSLSPFNGFRKMVVVNHEPLAVGQKPPKNAYILKDEKHINIAKKGLSLKRRSRLFNFCSEIGEWPAAIVREKIPQVTCRNNAMRHPVKCVEQVATTNTDVLQSYLIPLDSFADFMHYLKKCAKDEDLKIMYVLTRYIPKNRESFLYYTPKNAIEVVLFLNHGTTNNECMHAQQWTQKTIDQVLSYGGIFYLPVRTNASHEQMKRAYPHLGAFFNKKRDYDPQELFINHFYKKYAQ